MIVYSHAVPITEQSLDLIATNNGGLKPELELPEPTSGEPATYFLLPENPNDPATILSADVMFSLYEFSGVISLSEFCPIQPIGMRPQGL